MIAGSFYGHQNLDHFFFPIESQKYRLIDAQVQKFIKKSDRNSMTPVADYFDSVHAKTASIAEDDVLSTLATALRAVPAYDVSFTGRSSPSWLKAYATYLLLQYERVSHIKVCMNLRS